MSYEEYTWQKYYEDLYHRQKKENNALAVELGETEMKVAELEIALNRVIGSPFWKALAPARKIYKVVKKKPGNTAGQRANPSAVTDEKSTDYLYKCRLAEFENRYERWIAEDAIEAKYATCSLEEVGSLIDDQFHVFTIEECVGDASPVDKAKDNEWLVFTGTNGVFARGFKERLKDALTGNAKALIVYSDEDYACYKSDKMGILRVNPWFKPDWSPDTLTSYFYFGSFVMIKAELAKKTNWKGSEDGLLNVYDMFLQARDFIMKNVLTACEQASYRTPDRDNTYVLHIPQVLYHNIIEETEYNASILEDIQGRRTPIGAGKKYNSIKATNMIPGQDPDIDQPLYEVPEDMRISVLVLSKDHPETLNTCLSSFIERTNYQNLEFIVVDNGSTEENRAKYEKLIEDVVGEYPHKYIYQPMEFNFSKECNIAASNATGDMLLFLNDDIEIIQKDWLKLMAGYACQPHVGAVGAKLLYAGTDKIQHAGVTNLVVGPSHKLTGYSDSESYYYGRNTLNLNMLAVTAACLLIAKSKFNQLGGFDENLVVAYNDVDLCMRAYEAGYYNIQCNGAVLYHYESMSRGMDAENDNKWNRLLKEKEHLYTQHVVLEGVDPYYNCNLIQDDLNYVNNYRFGYENKAKTQIVRQICAGCGDSPARKLAEKTPEKYRFAIDYAGVLPLQSLKSPEIIEVRGWFFESGVDNFDQKVNIVLMSDIEEKERTGSLNKNGDERVVYEVETEVMPREELASVFQNECHVKLCGFDVKMLKKDIQEGTYRIGIAPTRLNDDLANAKNAIEVVFTDTYLTI